MGHLMFNRCATNGNRWMVTVDAMSTVIWVACSPLQCYALRGNQYMLTCDAVPQISYSRSGTAITPSRMTWKTCTSALNQRRHCATRVSIPTIFRASASFSSSSGQMSGQWVKPKYRTENSPCSLVL